MKYNLICTPLIAILLTACTFSETKKDNQIDPLIKEQIHVLNKQISDALVENNPNKVLAVSSDRLLEKKEEVIKLMQLLMGILKKPNFKVLNEYYQKNASKKHENVVSSANNNPHDYQIRYESLNKEMYVVVGYFEDKIDQKCFTFIYGKYGNEWKLNNMQAGILKIMNKDAIDWAQLAKSNYEKGYFIDALCKIGISTQLLKPANHLWKYKQENEILSFEQKVTKQTYTTYHFPLTVDYVETKPVIFRVYAQAMSEGYFPMIIYTTSIDLNDVPKLSKECNEMHEKIGMLFKGIDTNNKMILYKPMKSIPTGTETGKEKCFVKMTK